MIPVSDSILSRIEPAVALTDAWLDTMRNSKDASHHPGYGGPVAHWWGDCLHFTAAGLDWRYEGIISGYLNLYAKTGQETWLLKAQRAGDDLVTGQLPTGNYLNSSFELNPCAGGTPHEAACDLALLNLARVLRAENRSGWEVYLQTAERNLRASVLGVLWNPGPGYFQNRVGDSSFVPNKAATIVEALLAWMVISEQDYLLEKFVIPTLDRILECQVRAPGQRAHGAIDQACHANQLSGRYFPFYIARCIPALLSGYQVTGQQRYLDAGCDVMNFLLRARLEDGSFPQVIYANGKVNRAPRWVAAVGDLLRAMQQVSQYGMETGLSLTLDWLLAGQLPSGGFRTAHGFATRGFRPARNRIPEFRDLLPVCGWVDKAFRYLTSCLPQGGRIEPLSLEEVALDCTYRGRAMQYRESDESIELWRAQDLIYRWRKGSPWVGTWAG